MPKLLCLGLLACAAYFVAMSIAHFFGGVGKTWGCSAKVFECLNAWRLAWTYELLWKLRLRLGKRESSRSFVSIFPASVTVIWGSNSSTAKRFLHNFRSPLSSIKLRKSLMPAATVHVVVVSCPFTIIEPGCSILSLGGFRLGYRHESVFADAEKAAHFRRSFAIV